MVETKTKLPKQAAAPAAAAAKKVVKATKEKKSTGKKPPMTGKTLKLVRKLTSHKVTRPLWAKIKRMAAKKGVLPSTLVKKKPNFVVKKIGGEKNGGKRLVRVKKEQRYYPTEDKPRKRKTGKITFKMHKKTFKKGISPGRVVILLAGRHKGKRVVVLKTLPSGMLMITGPHKINGCPLRRMHQRFTIVTSTRVDVSGVKIPEHINDKYFKSRKFARQKAKGKKGAGNIFETKSADYKPNLQHRKDQVEVDKQIIEAIRKHPEKKLMFGYLGSYFCLRNNMYPHKMKF
ncbi:60S ribosomal protein L6-like [Panonychus citri]|uniref:60S ribosomal protein L6-like n=1 Tax=Panonychus citri TaxID=50023 RepID=UPI002307079B|nr:60S ribosomal protein L6-like [Panonychus citri]XP_053209304.1 60S ribosomal protein L6-like [Panonychus citri]